MTTLTFFEFLCSVYKKKSGQLLFHTYLLTCLNKDISVLLKVTYIWASQACMKFCVHVTPNGVRRTQKFVHGIDSSM